MFSSDVYSYMCFIHLKDLNIPNMFGFGPTCARPHCSLAHVPYFRRISFPFVWNLQELIYIYYISEDKDQLPLPKATLCEALAIMFSISRLLLFGFALSWVQESIPTTTKRLAEAFIPPINGGGSELDDAGSGVGEPMNVRTLHFWYHILPNCF